MIRFLVRPAIAFVWLTISVLAACAGPRIQPAGPSVQATQMTSDAFIMPDGTVLPYSEWRPAETAETIIIALHGFNDYRRAFRAPAAWWAQHGILTYAYDQRGFGETEMAGYWPGRAALTADLRHVLRILDRRHPGIPKIVLGESMGAAVAMTALAQDGAAAAAIEGMVLVAPAVWGWSTMNHFYQATLWLAAHTVPGLRLTGESLDIRPSDNLAMLRRMAADPLVIKKTRVDAIYGLVNLMDTAAKRAEAMPVPLLLLYGARDEVIPQSAITPVIDRLRQPVVIRYDDGFHMLLRDCQAPLVWRDILWWTGVRRDPDTGKGEPLPQQSSDVPENPQCDGNRVGDE